MGRTKLYPKFGDSRHAEPQLSFQQKSEFSSPVLPTGCRGPAPDHDPEFVGTMKVTDEIAKFRST